MAIFGVRGLCLVLNLPRISEKIQPIKLIKKLKKRLQKKIGAKNYDL